MPRLNIIGSGTPTWTPDRWGTCFVLDIYNERLMVDCGPGSTYKMYKMGISCTSVRNLFFTHLHSDHISDLLCFLMTRFDQSVGHEGDLNVYGPPPIGEIVDGLWSEEKGLFWYDVVARVNHPMSLWAFSTRGGSGERPKPKTNATNINEGEIASGDGWRCIARHVKHAQPYIGCFGFRFETDEGVVAFSGDTAPTDALVDLARDADVFVMEAAHREDLMQASPAVVSETGTISAAQIAAKANAKRLVIHHQTHTLDPSDQTTAAIAEIKQIYDGPLFWGRDMMTVDW